NAIRPRSAATISATSGATLSSSLCTGMTTESCGSSLMRRVRSGLVAQAFQHAVERVEAGVVDHQLALVAAAVEHRDPAAQRFRQLALQRGDVGLLRLRLGRALLRRRRQLAGGQLL